MSKLMGERMAKLENEVVNLKDANGVDHNRIECKIDKMGKKIDIFIDRAPFLFASKLTEKIVYGLVSIVLVAFATKLLNLW
jgi:hypothetical protein